MRLVAKAPYGRWRTLTFLAALRVDRIDATLELDRPISVRAFTAYVEPIPGADPGDGRLMFVRTCKAATSRQQGDSRCRGLGRGRARRANRK